MTQPQPGQFVKLRRSFERVVNVVPHHGDRVGVTSLVEVSYRTASQPGALFDLDGFRQDGQRRLL